MYGALSKTIFFAALAFAVPSAAFAGPPFFSDDPEPVEYQHWEIDTALQGTNVRGDDTGEAPLLEINYGVLPGLEVHVAPQIAYDQESGRNVHMGYGDTELGLKYRFINAGENDWWPEVGIAPLLEVPTGKEREGLSTTGKMREFLPIWVQKNYGPWETFGGGGYWETSGVGNNNYWYFGWVLQRKITDTLTLGGELYHQTNNTAAGDNENGASTGFNVGGSYDFNETYHLLFSAGKAVENVQATNSFSYYLGLQTTF